MKQIDEIQNKWAEESVSPELMKKLFGIINTRKDIVFEEVVETVLNQEDPLSKEDMEHITNEFFRCNTLGDDYELTRVLELELYHANKVEPK